MCDVCNEHNAYGLEEEPHYVGEEFLITIQCPKCSSINCEAYVAELSPNPRESDLAIRYRCLACNHMHDEESS